MNAETKTLNPYFNILKWRNGSLPLEENIQPGFPCFISFHFASLTDLAALQVLFPLPNRQWYTLGRYYLPLKTANLPGRETHLAWGKKGHIILTKGETIDFERIFQDVLGISTIYKVIQVAADPFQNIMWSEKLQNQGKQNVLLYGFNTRNFSFPMKKVASDIILGKMNHNGNPCMEWMMGNVMAREDFKQNVFPRTEIKKDLIEGPIALIMAMGIAQPLDRDSNLKEKYLTFA